jgi:glycosyltransferase involved in cell wall biosynthesis
VVSRLAFAVPGDLATPTGGYAYDRRIIAELQALGWTVDVVGLGDGFPRPSAEAAAGAEARLGAVPAGQPIVVDGLAFGVMPEVAARLKQSHPLVALVHHPLAMESSIPADEAAVFRARERAALGCTRGVIVTSAATGRLLIADYGVAPERITVAEPGTDRARIAARDPSGRPLLLAVGAVVPRKGYDVLVEALSGLTDLPWRLVIAGDCTRSPATVAALKDEIARLNLTERVTLVGAVSPDRLTVLYATADLFVLPSRFEGYGMAYTEAIAHGLPVVGTTAGAIPETVPPEAGMLVPPDDAAALTRVLHTLLVDAHARETLAAGARAAAARLPTWRDSALVFARAIEAVT